MKYKYILLLTAALAMGCRGNDSAELITDDMSDSAKLEALDRQLEKEPDDLQAHFLRAQVLFHMGRNGEAMMDIDKSLKGEPDNVDFLLLKGDICLKNGNMADCYKVLQHAEEVAPDNQEVLLDKYPDYALAFEELGVLYASRNENMALEYLNTAAKLDPSNTNTLYALAMFYQDREDFDNAETLYHQILDLNERSADAWHNLGWIELTHYHDYDRAIEYFDKALAIDPQMANAIANRQLALKAKRNEK